MRYNYYSRFQNFFLPTSLRQGFVNNYKYLHIYSKHFAATTMEGAGSSEYRKAFWTAEEDRILMDYVKAHGKGKWNRAAKVTGQNFFFLFLFFHVEGIDASFSARGMFFLSAKRFECCGLGLKRCGKSCRLRWINYLSPSVKHGGFSEEEDDLIIRLHKLLGNRFLFISYQRYIILS